jgi:hypothetical protein
MKNAYAVDISILEEDSGNGFTHLDFFTVPSEAALEPVRALARHDSSFYGIGIMVINSDHVTFSSPRASSSEHVRFLFD